MKVKNKVTGIEYNAVGYGRLWHLKDDIGAIKNTLNEDAFRENYIAIMDEPSEHGKHEYDLGIYKAKAHDSYAKVALRGDMIHALVCDKRGNVIAGIYDWHINKFMDKFEPIAEPSQDENVKVGEPSYLDKLRDMVACQVVPQLMSFMNSYDDIAKLAYKLADAVIIERMKARGDV